MKPVSGCGRIIRIKGEGAKAIQVGFLALNKKERSGPLRCKKVSAMPSGTTKKKKLYQSKSHFQ